MTEKKNQRVTIKMLSEEIRMLKEDVKKFDSLEKRIVILEQTVKDLENGKNVKHGNTIRNENCSELEVKCKVCDKSCESRRSLKKNINEIHPQQIECYICAANFSINSDLEAHMKASHESTEQYECDLCDKKFVLKWRLKKHKEGHANEHKKFCHYFNNEKSCPYEEIGCKFLHQNSEMCYFRKKCRNNLCQFKHVDNGVEEINQNELANKFNKLTDIEQSESKEVLCDFYCRASYDYHRCSDERREGFIGCDVLNITDDFENDDEEGDIVTYFPCEK